MAPSTQYLGEYSRAGQEDDGGLAPSGPWILAMVSVPGPICRHAHGFRPSWCPLGLNDQSRYDLVGDDDDMYCGIAFKNKFIVAVQMMGDRPACLEVCFPSF